FVCALAIFASPAIVWRSPGGTGVGRLGDVQVAAGVAEHDLLRRLARGARNGNCGRLPLRQYRLKPRNRRLLPRALLGGHHHLETVGLVDVVDQGRETLIELRPMGGHWSYVRRLD